MSKGKNGYPRLVLTGPFKEIYLPDLYNASEEKILREADKYMTEDGKPRLLWACNRRGSVIRGESLRQNRKKDFKKKKKFRGREDFDRVKWRVMKKFFTRIDNQKQHPESRKPYQKARRQFHGKKNGHQPVHSRMRDGGNHG